MNYGTTIFILNTTPAIGMQATQYVYEIQTDRKADAEAAIKNAEKMWRASKSLQLVDIFEKELTRLGITYRQCPFVRFKIRP